MKTIIGIVGFKGSGKDTAAQTLINKYGFIKDSFAGSLKDACASIFCWDREMLEGNTPEQRAHREIVDQWWANKLGIRDWSPRKALQYIGTEIMREHLHPTLWAFSVERRLMLENNSRIVVCDCRFRNEINLLKQYNAKIIRVKRGDDPEWFNYMAKYNNLIYDGIVPENPDDITEYIKPYLEKIHASERDWIGVDFDCVIENNGTLDDLFTKTSSYINTLGL